LFIKDVFCFLKQARRFCMLWFLLLGAAYSHSDPVLIAHPDINKSELARDELVRIYAMKKRTWENGTPVKVFILSRSSQVHRDFITGTLKMQPFQLNRLWNRLVFSGIGVAPTELVSQQEMVAKVRNTVGAIGYIDEAFTTQEQWQDLMVGEDEQQ
jgi:ABC-type phosphate transport system substrate-binding protein